MATSDVYNACVNIGAGSVGGILAALTGHPFDTLKVRLQTQPIESPIYSGLGDCVSKTWSSEGVIGFYRGLASPLCGMVIFNAVQFMAYGQAVSIVKRHSPDHDNPTLTIPQYLACGAMTGVAVSAVESPMDLFKSQVQVQIFATAKAGTSGSSTPPMQFRSSLDAASQIWNYGGVRSVYQGLSATLFRNVPAVALYFGAYEHCRLQFSAPNGDVSKLSSMQLLCSGGVAGICYWLFTYPADIVITDFLSRNKRKLLGFLLNSA
uniref:Mitochondrial carrier protein n=1 Tax=Spongospora subterranea TaxID=70186 RepID=A0A0H5QLI0_9EUKA|eukprot:CRZ03005.1 hypothetical protein [Spongospora subterranea]